jgi:hypothetical protein
MVGRRAARRHGPKQPRSPIPLLTALPLDRDAGGIPDLDPHRTRPGPIGAVDLLGNDPLSTKPASMREHRRAIFSNGSVRPMASLGLSMSAPGAVDVAGCEAGVIGRKLYID